MWPHVFSPFSRIANIVVILFLPPSCLLSILLLSLFFSSPENVFWTAKMRKPVFLLFRIYSSKDAQTSILNWKLKVCKNSEGDRIRSETGLKQRDFHFFDLAICHNLSHLTSLHSLNSCRSRYFYSGFFLLSLIKFRWRIQEEDEK